MMMLTTTIKLTCLSAAVAGALARNTDKEPTYYSSVTAGQGFSCGVLEATGRVECWGNGALGDPPSLDTLRGQLKDENHVSIAGGGFHVCGLYYNGGEDRSDHEAYCVASYAPMDPQDAGQTDIPELEDGNYWRLMSAGGMHTCGLDRHRMPYCWGSEEGNRRALGAYAEMEHRYISAGGLTTCGVLLDRTAYCVGDVPQGMLPEEYATEEFTMLEAGGAFTYGLLKDGKELIKFGPGEAAGAAFDIVESIPLTPPSGFRSSNTLTISAGAAHVCATGRRNRKAIRKGLPAKGSWCAGSAGEEVAGISSEA